MTRPPFGCVHIYHTVTGHRASDLPFSVWGIKSHTLHVSHAKKEKGKGSQIRNRSKRPFYRILSDISYPTIQPRTGKRKAQPLRRTECSWGWPINRQRSAVPPWNGVEWEAIKSEEGIEGRGGRNGRTGRSLRHLNRFIGWMLPGWILRRVGVGEEQLDIGGLPDALLVGAAQDALVAVGAGVVVHVVEGATAGGEALARRVLPRRQDRVVASPRLGAAFAEPAVEPLLEQRLQRRHRARHDPHVLFQANEAGGSAPQGGLGGDEREAG